MSNASDFIIENGVLVKYTGKGGEVAIPANVVKIGDNAFEKCSKLTGIILPEGLQEMGEHAFRLCKKLTRIVIPGSCKNTGFLHLRSAVGWKVLCSVRE